MIEYYGSFLFRCNEIQFNHQLYFLQLFDSALKILKGLSKPSKTFKNRNWDKCMLASYHLKLSKKISNFNYIFIDSSKRQNQQQTLTEITRIYLSSNSIICLKKKRRNLLKLHAFYPTTKIVFLWNTEQIYTPILKNNKKKDNLSYVYDVLVFISIIKFMLVFYLLFCNLANYQLAIKMDEGFFFFEQTKYSQLSTLIEDRFSVIKRFKRELTGLTYTSASLLQFIQAFIKCIINIGDGEIKEDKRSIQKLFSSSIILEKKQEKIFFGEFLKQFHKIKNGQINQSHKSRIYHEIANAQKKKKEEEKIQKNTYGLEMQKTYEYKYLSDEQMDEVVKLQHVGEQIQKLGEAINFKLDSVRKQTEAITLLLGKTFANYADYISTLEYDLNEEEVMHMAKIARQACYYYENGVYLLVVYFIKSCNYLQKQNKKVPQIQEKLNAAIDIISKKYPPGQNLSRQDQKYDQKLDKIRLQKQPFTFPNHNLNKNSQKQQQLESIIKQQARIAKQCKPLLETLVKCTCLENCLSFKLGLKYNTDSPNHKSLTRIIEKMLFKNDIKEKGKYQSTNVRRIDQQLNQEDQDYQDKIKQKLQNQQSVLFTISDMVRGKCIFNSIEDIIEAFQKIEKYVADNADSYRLIEVESRFKNATPISDVTLKIAIKQKIIAQLQLTLQTNAAVYTFAHKIYQFFRTKVFSKIKLVDNYRKEFEQQFTTMIRQRVKLVESDEENSSMNELTQDIKNCIQKIQTYFDLKQDKKSKSFGQLLREELNKIQSKIGEGQLWAEEELQDLILPIFCIRIGEWGSRLGDKINTIILKNNHSSVFKSTLLYFFYSHIDGEQHFQFIEQFLSQRKEQIIQQQQNNQQWKKQKIQFQEYIKYDFKIQGVDKYHNDTASLFYQFKGLSAMIDCDFIEGSLYHKQPQQIDRIFGENSEQTVLSLMKFAKVCFLRKQYFFSLSLCARLIHLIQTVCAKEDLNKTLYIAIVQLLMAQNYLQQDIANKAMQLLQRNLTIFHEKEDHKREIECDLMLVECRIKQPSEGYILDYKKSYQNVLQKAKGQAISLKSRTIADTEWRIAQRCWKIAKAAKDKEMQRETLDNHYRRAMVLFSAYNIEKFVIASKTISWGEFEKNNLKNPQLRENRLIVILDLTKKLIGTGGCEVLKKAKIFNLTQLFLEKNAVGSQGCNHLATANWINLSQLHLSNNSIGNQGCQHLSRSTNWSNLGKLDLGENKIGRKGCQSLSTVNWPNLSQLDLRNNSIGSSGCQYLRSASWPKLRQLNLDSNSIGNQGCHHLSNANWPNLSQLDLKNNAIGIQGCKYLSQAYWQNLIKLNLKHNLVGNQGCQHLRDGNWSNLSQLNLQDNAIKSQGCQFFITVNWENLSQLNLSYNSIGNQGCQYLIRANLPNICQLNLEDNEIESQGCDHLRTANWPELRQLNLGNNLIGIIGCKYLVTANWPNLSKLDIGYNSIRRQGFFRREKLSNLSQLALELNQLQLKDRQLLKIDSQQYLFPS